MSDVTLENKDMTMEELLQSEEFNKTLKLPRNGEIVDGKVHQVNNEEVIVNLGVKKDGILQKSEASLEEGQTLADAYKVGDEIKAKVIKTDDGDGGILLSTKKLEYIANWEENYDGIHREDSVMTTPESLTVHEMLANMRASKVRFATMEVSSQALKYKRVRELFFEVVGPSLHSDRQSPCR